MQSLIKYTITLILCSVGILLLLVACTGPTTPGTTGGTSISIVAAENFYGDIAQQLGGRHVRVTSLLADPNVDPHDYEPTPRDALTVADANIVIANGSGYDGWMDRLLSSSTSDNRVSLKAWDLAKTRLPANEHVWYNTGNMQSVAEAITTQLKHLDSAHATDYDNYLQTFQQSLQKLQQTIQAIRSTYHGTAISATETIYQYQADELGLKIVTPLALQRATSEGNDPPANSILTAESQLRNHEVKVLVYNQQTVTPITTKLQNDAKAQHIPIVPITETMPRGKTYQSWMHNQLTTLQQALQQA